MKDSLRWPVRICGETNDHHTRSYDMTRYIVILALVLTAGLSSGNASAQQANVPLLALCMVNTAEAGFDSMAGMLM